MWSFKTQEDPQPFDANLEKPDYSALIKQSKDFHDKFCLLISNLQKKEKQISELNRKYNQSLEVSTHKQEKLKKLSLQTLKMGQRLMVMNKDISAERQCMKTELEQIKHEKEQLQAKIRSQIDEKQMLRKQVEDLKKELQYFLQYNKVSQIEQTSNDQILNDHLICTDEIQALLDHLTHLFTQDYTPIMIQTKIRFEDLRRSALRRPNILFNDQQKLAFSQNMDQ